MIARSVVLGKKSSLRRRGGFLVGTVSNAGIREGGGELVGGRKGSDSRLV